MNLLLVEPSEIAPDGLVRLTGRRAEHLVKVLRVEPGRELRLGRIGGGRGTAEVSAVDPAGAVELRVALPLASDPPAPPRLDVMLALPRPAVLHRVLQNAAALGLGRLDLVNAWRVEKSYFQSPALAPDAVRKHLLLGAEQGMSTRLPEVRIHKLLVPFVRSLEEERGERRLVAHPGAPALETVLAGPPGPLRLAVGPEGGWIDREVETLGEAGFVPVGLGPWVLRVENALTALVAQVELLRRLG